MGALGALRLAALLGLAVAAHAAGPVVDPMAPGPYPVARTTVTLTKTSVTTGQPRVLDTLVWYPAAETGSSAGGAFVADVVRRRWPLLVFSHGSCGVPAQSTFLMTALASWGMVVAAPPHPGNTAVDGFEQCGLNLADSYANRVPDVMFVVDRLLAEAKTRGSLFHRRIRPKRIGIMGHSFGGQTVLRALFADKRFRAGIALAPGAATDIVVKQPLLVVTGALDSLTPFETDAREAFAVARGKRYLVRLSDTGHCAFIPLCAPVVCGDGCPPTGIDVQVVNDRVRRLVVPFTLRYVAGNARFKPFLEPATMPAGIEMLEVVTRGP